MAGPYRVEVGFTLLIGVFVDNYEYFEPLVVPPATSLQNWWNPRKPPERHFFRPKGKSFGALRIRKRLSDRKRVRKVSVGPERMHSERRGYLRRGPLRSECILSDPTETFRVFSGLRKVSVGSERMLSGVHLS